MNLILQRRIDTGKQTLGVIYLDNAEGRQVIYVLEDTYRPVKVKHKTRISAGVYQLEFRKYGSHYKRYIKKFPDLNHNRGMIQIMNVENFTDILIHIGNTETDTSGCLLVGLDYVESDGEVRLISSTLAYRKLYQIIADALESGEAITLEIIDEKEISNDEIDDMIRGVEL